MVNRLMGQRRQDSIGGGNNLVISEGKLVNLSKNTNQNYKIKKPQRAYQKPRKKNKMVNQSEQSMNPMEALYYQQYMQYMHMIQTMTNQLQEQPEPVKAEPEIDQSEPVISKPIKLSFGIDAILSDDFGPKVNRVQTSDDSRSNSPVSSWEDQSECGSSVVGQRPKGQSGSRGGNRARTIFSDDQLNGLEMKFQENQYLVGDERIRLASQLGLNVKQVKIWFQNRRIKHRRSNKQKYSSDSD